MADYSNLNISELRLLCKERGLKGYTGHNKNNLVKLLNNTITPYVLQDHAFIFQPMITYIGNKRKLIPWITEVVQKIHAKIGKRHIKIFDGFAGSGVVSRALMPFCSELHSNDMEVYSYILLQCFLVTPSAEQHIRIETHFININKLCQTPTEIGFISTMYSPKNTEIPVLNERCFYTHENALIIDTLIKYISSAEQDIRPYLLGPLLIKASINVNTAGVFRGFYKKDGIGHFGGTGENALDRILMPIQPVLPIWSKSSCKSICYNSDINNLIQTFENNQFDLIYLDPPYNEHPYGSNYFMLNLIANGQQPAECSKVSGIPKFWNKSAFNSRISVFNSMLELLRICLTKSTYVLISYNNEGLITEDNWTTLFTTLKCSVKKYEKEYDTYHGSRNLTSRNTKVIEIMYLISATAVTL